jgi:hypothetical protein
MEITHTDVAMVKMHDDVLFVNETFESSLEGIRPTQLQILVTVDSLMPGNSVYMNSPFVGYSEGVCGPHTRNRIPHDDPSSQPTFEWIKTHWCYIVRSLIFRLAKTLLNALPTHTTFFVRAH